MDFEDSELFIEIENIYDIFVDLMDQPFIEPLLDPWTSDYKLVNIFIYLNFSI